MAKSKSRYVPAEEFRRYIEAKALNTACVRCGEAGWDLHDTEQQLGMVGLHNGPDGQPSGMQSPLLTLSCKNCATVWTLLRYPVQTWLDANPEEIPADE